MPVYLVFLDVTKAYDKAWSDGIMYAMHNNGVTGPLWNMIRKMNQNLTARIKTKDGMTRPIQIKDSIRQGGVLSVIQYALLMDEIAKEIKNENYGCQLNDNNEKIGCLLWMDDVVLISDNPKELQKMLDITYRIAGKYHIEFGEEKSKAMTIGTRKKPDLHLGDMKLEHVTNYKYLGELLDDKMKLETHLDKVRTKTEGTYQMILSLAYDPYFNDIEMETIWELVETCVISVITYGAETWKPTPKETEQANRILDNIIKRILMTPRSTPREPLYIETGLLDIEHTIRKNRHGMYHRIHQTQNDLLGQILQLEGLSWKNYNNMTMFHDDLESDEILNLTKDIAKKTYQTSYKRKFPNTN